MAIRKKKSSKTNLEIIEEQTSKDGSNATLEDALNYNYKPSVKKITGLMAKTSENIVIIGEILNAVKSEAPTDEYKAMYNDLPFAEKTGSKFIAISEDKYIKKYIKYCPPSYNTMYERLLNSKSKPKNEWVWKYLVKAGLNFSSTDREVKIMLDEYAFNNIKLGKQTKCNLTPNKKLKTKLSAAPKVNLTTNNATFSGDVINISFDSNITFNSNKENKDKLNKMIEDIESYARECVSKYGVSNVISINSKELSFEDLGVAEEDATSKKDIELKEVA